MEIIIGKTAGFCYGVKRAVDGSLEQIKQDKKVYCLGELVHNKQVIDKLKNIGIEIIEKIEDVKEMNSKVIIRAHGVEKNIYEKARKEQLELVDYTCPNVLKIHKIADEYAKNGYYIFLTGAEKHPEVIGIISYCGDKFSLIESEEDVEVAIEKFRKEDIRKLLIISQTTYSVNKFKKITNMIKDKIEGDVDLVVKNTICLATESRQKETKELSTKVDFMIIIGGKNSSNTRKLYEIAKQNSKDAILIENSEEAIESLREKDLSEIKKIGIMAGASTPSESIEEVVNIFKQ